MLANACGNGNLPLNVFENIGSLIQGEENAIALDGTQQVVEDDHHVGNGDYEDGEQTVF